MTQPLTFERWEGPQPYVFTFWPDGELRIFRDEAAATRWAAHQGLRAVFAEAQPIPEARLFRCIDCGSFVDCGEMSWGLCGACQVKAQEESNGNSSRAALAPCDSGVSGADGDCLGSD